jgi:uncharacterized small protein (DUF1192 family)
MLSKDDREHIGAFSELIERVKATPEIKGKDELRERLRAFQQEIATGRKRPKPSPCKNKREGTEWQPI